MDHRDFDNILNSMLETGVYVVRQENCQLLYMNQCARMLSPAARLEACCPAKGSELCAACPLQSHGGQGSGFCGLCPQADVTISRLLWEGITPAFLLMAIPRTGVLSLEQARRDSRMANILKSRFRMLNTVFLESGHCQRVDLSNPAGAEITFIGDYATFIEAALSRQVHPEDTERYWSTLALEHLREKARQVEDYAEEVCVYRTREEPTRWIELRVIYTRWESRVSVNILGQDVTRMKQQEESQLHSLAERDYMLSSLSTLFFSTYYVNLLQDTFRAVTQLRRVEDLLGEEVNWTAGLQIYAQHFIHPEDREAYLQVMSIENLRKTLRWWQPYVAVEYRTLPDLPGEGEGQWVRATAVLAQTGDDDLPATAVYVAQSLSNTRRPASMAAP